LEVHSYRKGLLGPPGDERMKACHAQVLDHLVAAKGDKRFRERLNKRSCKVLSENTSPSEASYSTSICCGIDPKAFRKMWSFHIDHQVLNPLIEKVNDRSTGIGMWRSSNRL
jgi:hypothetical protein